MSPTTPARGVISDSVLPADLAARTRIGNTAWCSRTKCAALPTERECCCCRELAHIRHLFSDVEGLQCITDHPEFVGACLNPLTLRIALVGVIATRGDPTQLIYYYNLQSQLIKIGNRRLCYANCACNCLIINATYIYTCACHVHMLFYI